ncbi:hypothetical protein RYF40_002987 [Klebsiella oxytoca]|uniref:Uncharacterized protein n=1 Tax=Klebsiella oxytoca TaxID=571 RepID=A0AAI9DXT2_KLEOX|nr:hypothetical protein [Klebsiella oxytoca]HED2847424.1 hypothetical protein [Klebsiella oxytoca]
MTIKNDITELALLISKAKASVFTLEYISQFEPADIDSDDVDLRFEVDGRETGTNVSIVDECGQAAKVIDELVEALEKAQQVDDELCKLLPPGIEYMDPPDGGSVTPLEQVCRMIADYRQRIAALESQKSTLMKFISDSCYVFDGDDADISDAYVDAISSALMPKLESVPVFSLPLFWVRVKSDGGYDDSKLEDVRKKSGEWLPLALAREVPEMESRTVTVKLPRPGFVTISGERTAVYLKADVDAVLADAGIEEAE